MHTAEAGMVPGVFPGHLLFFPGKSTKVFSFFTVFPIMPLANKKQMGYNTVVYPSGNARGNINGNT